MILVLGRFCVLWCVNGTGATFVVDSRLYSEYSMHIGITTVLPAPVLDKYLQVL